MPGVSGIFFSMQRFNRPGNLPAGFRISEKPENITVPLAIGAAACRGIMVLVK